MTHDEKLDMLVALLGLDENDDDAYELMEVYLDAAGREILAWRYSYATEVYDEVPAEYEMAQIHAVMAGYSISGAEGQVSHSENGISRTFKYPDMLAYIRANVIPIARVI